MGKGVVIVGIVLVMRNDAVRLTMKPHGDTRSNEIAMVKNG